MKNLFLSICLFLPSLGFSCSGELTADDQARIRTRYSTEWNCPKDKISIVTKSKTGVFYISGCDHEVTLSSGCSSLDNDSLVNNEYEGLLDPVVPKRSICRNDNDCKLIRSSCGCSSIRRTDTDKFKRPEVVCRFNNCNPKLVKAVCRESVCVRSDGNKNN